MLTFIYCLADPTDCVIHYIGASFDPIKRLKSHCSEQEVPTQIWISALKELGLAPFLGILEVVDSDDSKKAGRVEYYWIALHRELGSPLLNIHPGGGGIARPSIEARTKMSVTRLALSQEPEFREQMLI